MDAFIDWGRLILIVLSLAIGTFVFPANRVFRNPFLFHWFATMTLVGWVFGEAAFKEGLNPFWSDARSIGWMLLTLVTLPWMLFYHRRQ